MSVGDDRDVRDAFEALGRRLASSAPNFELLASPAALQAARWRRRRRSAVLAVAAIVLPAVFLLKARDGDALDYERFTALTGIDLGEVTWEAPSDVLLDVPGRDLLQRVPIIDIQMPAVLSDSTRPPVTNDSQRRSRS